MLVRNDTDEQITNEQGQEMIRRTIERFGRMILSADNYVPLGAVQEFAGLPLKATRYVTEAEAFQEHWPEVWGPWEAARYYFEVVVAD
jgi:hypothetical protein